jgi:hypothetical protein
MHRLLQKQARSYQTLKTCPVCDLVSRTQFRRNRLAQGAIGTDDEDFHAWLLGD